MAPRVRATSRIEWQVSRPNHHQLSTTNCFSPRPRSGLHFKAQGQAKRHPGYPYPIGRPDGNLDFHDSELPQVKNKSVVRFDGRSEHNGRRPSAASAPLYIAIRAA